jgi:hypothetical protein
MTATISTPLPFNAGRFWMYPGRCLAEHPGVKAPGTEKRTTFFPANSVEMVSFLFGVGEVRGCFDKSEAQRRERWQKTVRTLGSIIVDWDTARSYLASFGSIWDVTEGDALWEAISDLEFRHLCW